MIVLAVATVVVVKAVVIVQEVWTRGGKVGGARAKEEATRERGHQVVRQEAGEERQEAEEGRQVAKEVRQRAADQGQEDQQEVGEHQGVVVAVEDHRARHLEWDRATTAVRVATSRFTRSH